MNYNLLQTNKPLHIIKKVVKSEEKGRVIAEKVLDEIFEAYDCSYSVAETTLFSHVDMEGKFTSNKTGVSKNFQLEIKQRIKSKEQFEKYGYNVELRVDKYQRMLIESPEGDSLLYMVLVNQTTAYIFRMKELDWSKVEKFNWRIRETQVDDNSIYKVYPTYKIPLELASFKIDITKYCLN